MQSASKNSFWYLTFNISRLAVVFVGTILISRVMGPHDFGEFSYLLSIFLYSTALDSLCHESVVKKDILNSKEEGIGAVLGSASMLCVILSVIAGAMIGVFALFFLENSAHLAALLLFLPGVFSKPTNPIGNYFDSKLLSKYSSLALFLGGFFSILFRLGSLYFSKDLVFQTIGYSLQGLICSAALLLFFRVRSTEKAPWSVDSKTVISIFRRSAPIFFSTILFMSLSLSDVFMIKHILSAHEVGIYSVVMRFSEPWVIISSALCTSYFPVIFREAGNKLRQREIFVQVNSISALIVLVLGIVLTLSMNIVVPLTVGPQFNEAIAVFAIYFWGVFFLFWANIQHIWEVHNGHYYLSLYKTLFSCCVKIGLNLYLGQRFGLKGFAVATVVAYFFFGFGFNIFGRYTREYMRMQMDSLRWSSLWMSLSIAYSKGVAWKNRRF
ncbi:flippase [Bdellovibrio sp. HCB337]|uniref:flippase n=1 Tax=Bdellovibrio sp. HCB337 TaxID=3394358 RepID=UPI0039A7584C